jgi:calcineurin-like phosphoesterase family protein
MNEGIISNWNEKVPKDGIVFHLGDFCMGSIDNCIDLLDRLNGEIYLIKGNHDQTIIKTYNKHRPKSIVGLYNDYMFNSDGLKIHMYHYPIISWNSKHHGSWHLFGHCHGTINKTDIVESSNMLDIGVDSNNYTPWNYYEIKDVIDNKLSLYEEKKREKI